MKSIGWVAVLLFAVVSVGAWAQCGCETPVDPDCYRSFRMNETIEFSLMAPIDYFMVHQTNESPGLLGWRVEDMDGMIVRSEIFSGEPRGRWMSMEWELDDYSGCRVDPGQYRIIVMSTAGDVPYIVRLIGPCDRGCNCCFCGILLSSTCDSPCRIPYGELYLSLREGRRLSTSSLSFSLSFQVQCGCGSP